MSFSAGSSSEGGTAEDAVRRRLLHAQLQAFNQLAARQLQVLARTGYVVESPTTGPHTAETPLDEPEATPAQAPAEPAAETPIASAAPEAPAAPLDARPFEAKPVEARPVEARLVEARPVESGPKTAPTPTPTSSTLDAIPRRPPACQTSDQPGEPLQLSFAQQRLWFVHKMQPHKPTYNVPFAYRTLGRLDAEALRRALLAVAWRHEGLRTVFPEHQGEPRQQIHARPDVPLRRVDLSRLPAQRRRRLARRLMLGEAQGLFDVYRGPLLRALVLHASPRRAWVVFNHHHIVTDGWSISILLDEVSAFYQAALAAPELTPRRLVRQLETAGTLSPLPIQYADFALWQRQWLSGERLQNQTDYWRHQLADAPTLELPLDRPRQPVQRFLGGGWYGAWSGSLMTALETLARRRGVTPFMVFAAVFGVLLHRLSGQRDLVFGTPVANRTRPELEGLIGFFVNNLVLRLRLDDDAQSLGDLLHQIRQVAFEAYAHQELPFEALIGALQLQRDLSRNPLFQVVMALQNTPDRQERLANVELQEEHFEEATSRMDMEVQLRRESDRLALEIYFDLDLLDVSTVARWMGHFRQLLRQAIADPERPWSTLAPLDPAQRHQLLYEGNDVPLPAAAPVSPDATAFTGDADADLVPERIHKLAERWPERLALTQAATDTVSLPTFVSYRELTHRADRLATALRARGVGANVPVAVCLPPGPDLVLVELAVLRAGGAFVPLDPDDTSVRRSAMLAVLAGAGAVLAGAAGGRASAESDLPLVLTDAASLDDLQARPCRPLVWNEAHAHSGPTPHTPVAREVVHPLQPAYLVFTSGSTGEPKGVVIRQQNLAFYCRWHRRVYGTLPDDRASALSPPAFDASIGDIWPALAAGASVWFPPAAARRSPSELVRWADRCRLTLWHLPTPTAEACLRESLPPTLAVRHMLCGGDRLRQRPPHAARFVFSNGYGPSECTVCSSRAPVPPEPTELEAQRGGAPSLGLPVPGARLFLLDRRGREVAFGVTGQIHIAGPTKPGDTGHDGGVGGGYWGDPRRTAEAFRPAPAVTGQTGGRLYRTGDLARRLPDGRFDFLGRTDGQLKVRGFRVEPGEIELALTSMPEVAEAVVIARDDLTPPGLPPETRLVAYVVAAVQPKDENQEQPTVSSLRAALAEQLPDYLIPAFFVLLPHLPLTANAKVDTRTLPAPDVRRPDLDRDYVAPRGQLQRRLAAIWRQVLGVDRVGIHDNFFELGGTSLLMVQVQSRVEELVEREIPVVQLFAQPTLARLTDVLQGGDTCAPTETLDVDSLRGKADKRKLAQRRLTERKAERKRAAQQQRPTETDQRNTPPPHPTPDTSTPAPSGAATSRPALRDLDSVPRRDASLDEVRVSFAQQRLWFMQRMMPGRSSYNVPFAYQLRDRPHIGALHLALYALVQRHEILRTRFADRNGQAHQLILPLAQIPPAFSVVDLDHLPEPTQLDEASHLATRESSLSFDLERGPMLRVRLLRGGRSSAAKSGLSGLRGRARSWLLIDQHHIVTDGWSLSLVLAELSQLYDAALRRHKDKPPTPERIAAVADQLPAPPLQYADFTLWQRRRLDDPQLSEALIAPMRQRLAQAPTLELPLDRPRPPVQSFEGAFLQHRLPVSLVTAAETLGRQRGATPFIVLSAVFFLLLYRTTGQRDLIFGTPVAGRLRPELEQILGCFINTLVFRLRLDDVTGDGFSDLLTAVQEVAMEAYAQQELPFERLVEIVRVDRDLSRNPLFQVLFAMQNTVAEPERLGRVKLERFYFPVTVSRAEMEIQMVRRPEALHLDLYYADNLLDATTVLRLLKGFQHLLETVVARPGTPWQTLDSLGIAERHQLLREWNDAAVEPPATEVAPLVPWQIVRHAKQRPDALVATRGRVHVTWGELLRRCRRLAFELQRRGVTVDMPVATCLTPSPRQLIAQFAVMLAGAGYAPLDPADSSERPAFMAEDIDAPVLLTEAEHSDRFAHLPTERLELDDAWLGALPDPPADVQLPPPLHAHNLAYVIFTSGSTGRPKGSLLSHANLANFARWHVRDFSIVPTDRASKVAGPAFDAAMWDTWPNLAGGASLWYPADSLRKSPQDLLDWLASRRLTYIFLPTPMAEAVLRLPVPRPFAARFLTTGGDRLLQRPRPQARFDFVNVYGPTECTVIVTTARVPSVPTFMEARGNGNPTLGRPLDNARLYVLDVHQRPVGAGVHGEAWIAGAGLSRGYLGMPQRTADVFRPDPFPDSPGERMYRTGDLTRLRADGTLDFLGRIDFQVKVRGLRIELGEVEAALNALPFVRKAVVLARQDGGPQSEVRLVAYIVPRPGPTPNVTVLRVALNRKLPDYMVPAAFVILEQFPMTANDKIDRKALPAPEGERPELAKAYVAPEGQLQRRLAEIWQDILGLDRVGIHDNFFDLGGSSLLMMEVQSRLRDELDRDIPVVKLFAHATLHSLSEFLGGAPEPAKMDVSSERSQADKRKEALLRRRQRRG